MKKIAILLSILGIALLACNKVDGPDIDSSRQLVLLESSRTALAPYYGKSQVVFVDSTGRELTFKVRLEAQTTTLNKRYLENPSNPADTTQLVYYATGDLFTLLNDSLGYAFYLQLFPDFTGFPIDSIKPFDALSITFFKSFSAGGNSVFYKVIDTRGLPASTFSSLNVTDPTRTFLGTTFTNVEHTVYLNPPATAFYTTTNGIVAFTDYEHRLWRLKG